LATLRMAELGQAPRLGKKSKVCLTLREGGGNPEGNRRAWRNQRTPQQEDSLVIEGGASKKRDVEQETRWRLSREVIGWGAQPKIEAA